MKKKIFIGIVGLFAMLIMAGCGKNNPTANTVGSNSNNNQQNAAEADFFKNQTKATLNDLVMGKKAMAVGTSNSDGSIGASRILIGDVSNFGFGNRMRPSSSTPSEKPNFGQGNGQGNGNNFYRGNNNGGNGGNGGNRGNFGRMKGGNSMGRANGEIIKKDGTSIVLKLVDGGSKIVYLSDKTEVYIFNPQSLPQTANSSSTSTPTTSTTK